jgi:hypothetical protein
LELYGRLPNGFPDGWPLVHLDLRSGNAKAMNNVLYILLGGLLWVIGYEATKAFLSRYVHSRREKNFLRFVRITFPNAKIVEVISASSSDKQALENIERRLRDASRTL